MTKIKNIIFDLGGVILDINRAGAVKKFKEIGLHNIEELIDPYRQKGIFLKIEEGSISREDFYAEIRKLIGRPVKNEDIDQGWLDFLLPVKQEKLDFISELRREYKVFLLSNTNAIIMEWAQSNTFSPAGKPLNYYFDEMYLSYKLGCMKPDIEIFHKTIKLSGVNPSETLFIDDSRANTDAGNLAGFQTFWFKEGSQFQEIKNRLL
ncbi:MAG: HAD family phosphatase [Prevotellaceae bacterium]|jgi:putative hydrolase of the HAD superfamily|nr:HAD family phosphatase [Prevotellaceae bacterium]